MAVKALLPFGTEFTPQRWLKSQTESLLVFGLYDTLVGRNPYSLPEAQDGAKQSDGAKQQAFINFARNTLSQWGMNFVLEAGISKLARRYTRIDLFLQRPLTTRRVTAELAITGCLYFQLRRMLEQRRMLVFQKYFESREYLASACSR